MTAEFVADGDWNAVRRNLDTLARLLDTGGRALTVRIGSGTVTWGGGSQDTADVTVTHGLGKTPAVVLTQSASITAMTRPASVGASTFTVRARTLDGSSPAAATAAGFYWLAIG